MLSKPMVAFTDANLSLCLNELNALKFSGIILGVGVGIANER